VFSPNGANGAGSFPYIWDTFGPDWKVFDANTGRLIYTITNVSQPPGFLAYAQILAGGFDPMNSILAYYVDGTNDWLLMWNSTRMLSAYAGYLSENLYSAPVGQTIDWTQGIQWNVTIPHHEGQSFGIPGSPGSNNGITPSDGNVIFTTTASLLAAVDNFTVTAYSCKTGSQLWSRDFSDMFTPGSTTFEFWGTVYDGVMALYNRETREWYGYDESTGNRLWGPTAPLPAAWDTFTSSTAGYDKLFVGTYAGNIYCYDIKNGTLEWTYNLPSSGYNTPYGGYPLLGGITVADGKIYAATGEHTPNNPYYLGAAMYCVNATTGKLIYQMSGWWSSSPFIADGYAVNQNCYDGTIYSFGKGQTAVTVSAPDTVATLGQSIVIKGTVMDESPGAMDYAGNRLSKDTPAIADAYMTEWMEYLYQQKPMPTNATGVTVSLDVVDSNGNFRNIGTTTSDATGAFSYVWQPDITGKYTLYASFAGSESYYGSSTETAFAVSEAPTAPPTATPVAQAPVETYFTVSTIAIIVAIVIVGVLMLRKRP
jgi:outer membrane protein assembly factor BamB